MEELNELLLSHKPTYICSHIFENSKPILYVCKDGGEFQFLCGGEHPDDEIPRVVGMSHILNRDKSLLEVMDLEDGWEAERKEVDKEWERRKC